MKKKTYQTFVALWHSNRRKGLTKLKKRCASAPTAKKIASMENGKKSTKRVTEKDNESFEDAHVEIWRKISKRVREEDDESADNNSVEIGKKNGKRVREEDESTDSEEWCNVCVLK